MGWEPPRIEKPGDENPMEQPQILIDPEQVQKRVQELGREISEFYRGKTLHAVCVLDDAFMFMADLVRALDIPVICGFVKPRFNQSPTRTGQLLQIFFSPEIEVKGQHVLLVEAVVSSGVTAEFLMRNLAARGAASVKMVTLLDKQEARRVLLQPDFFGFQVEDAGLIGYGLGGPQLGRNLRYIARGARPVAEAEL
jgi:hypoxanthine phosphoribosyltransferase